MGRRPQHQVPRLGSLPPHLLLHHQHPHPPPRPPLQPAFRSCRRPLRPHPPPLLALSRPRPLAQYRRHQETQPPLPPPPCPRALLLPADPYPVAPWPEPRPTWRGFHLYFHLLLKVPVHLQVEGLPQLLETG